MKLSNIILPVATGALLLSSCSKVDDYLDKAPASNLSYVETISDCDLLLNNPTLLLGFDHTYFLDDNVEFDNIEMVPAAGAGTTLYREYTYWPDDHIVQPAEDDPAWNRLYQNIYYTNVILNRIDEVSGSDNVKRSQIKGEALMSRAYYHFMLVNLFAKQYNKNTSASDPGIPVVQDIDTKAIRQRGTVEGTYTLILEDLNNALKFLKDEKPAAKKTFRGSLAGAYALLAKVYMNMQDWPNAVANAEKSLSYSPALYDYNKYATFNDFVNDPEQPQQPFNSRESIYLKGGNTAMSISYEFAVNMGAGGLRFTKELSSAIDTSSDIRFRLFMKIKGDTISLNKSRYKDPQLYALSNAGIALADTYLMLAEAYARNGQLDKAVTILNSFTKNRYKSSKYQPFQSSNKAAIIAKVLTERKIEFAFTGTRWFDMRRLFALGEYSTQVVRKDKNNNVIATFTPSYSTLVMPIPEKITALNPNITQNK